MPIDPALVEKFMLVFIRIASALAVLPVFSHASVPHMLKAGLAGIMALFLVMSATPADISASGTILDFFGLALRECVLGLLLGFVGQMLFFSVEMAGQMIGYQIGFSFSSSVDPTSEAQSTVMTQFYNVTVMLIFLVLNGHHMMLSAVADSLKVIPLGGLKLSHEFMDYMVAQSGTIMADGVRIAAPLMVTLLVADVGLGVLTRIAPAMNVFVIGFPLKIVAGLLMAAASLRVLALIFSGQLQTWANSIPTVLKLAGAP